MTTERVAEAVVVSTAAVALGTVAGSAVGLGLPVAITAGVNGAICGWRGIYRWSNRSGIIAFALDSTWAIGTTAAGLVAHAVGAARGDSGYSPGLSERQNRHVYERGFQTRKGFALSVGNVVSGAGDVTAPRRERLVNDHENVHVWQARWFGPLYPVVYVGWTIGGSIVGAIIWLTSKRESRFNKVVESCSYYLNPFEWWAYSRDDNWPPAGLIPGLGWRRPAVKSFASGRSATSPD